MPFCPLVFIFVLTTFRHGSSACIWPNRYSLMHKSFLSLMLPWRKFTTHTLSFVISFHESTQQTVYIKSVDIHQEMACPKMYFFTSPTYCISKVTWIFVSTSLCWTNLPFPWHLVLGSMLISNECPELKRSLGENNKYGSTNIVQRIHLFLSFCRLMSVWSEKIAKCLCKLPKNDFTQKMIDFDTFT